jgi:aminocarboxymuconate-semialdehyde decarboxylase
MNKLCSCDLKEAGASREVVDRGPRKRLVVDIHCHVHSVEAEGVVAPLYDPLLDPVHRFSNELTLEINRRQARSLKPRLTSVEARLTDMDRLGIDIQAISPAPHQYYYWAEPDLGLQAARLANDGIAQIVYSNPRRFVGLGTVPLQAPDLAVRELERMVKQLGFRGVEIATNVAGTELSEPQFRKFFAKAQELGVLVFMHPLGTSEGARLTQHYFVNVIGHPFESTVAVSHLIFGGVLDDCPDLKVCVAHGGGYLPSYVGRMDHAHSAREDCRLNIRSLPSSYLKKNFYFDTVVFTTHQLEYLVAQYGSEHVLLGTDYPYDMGEADPVGFVNGAQALSEQDRAAILGGNAARLLGIPAAERIDEAP